jgi:serine/threonine protein kinase
MASPQARHLVAQIEHRSVLNVDGHKIVPYGWLKQLLTLDMVEGVIHAEPGVIQDYERRSIAKDICDHGLKAFATLLLVGKSDLIYHFMRLDSGVSPGSPDNKLPLDVSALESIFRTAAAKEDVSPDEWHKWRDGFFRHQFMFALPRFPQRIPHRQFSPEIRLPFLRPPSTPAIDSRTAKPDTKRGGHFGDVFRIRLPPAKFDAPEEEEGPRMVCKQLKTKGGDAYERELRCLHLLNSIQHPNVVQVLGSFTQDGTHSFLFQEAGDGDLYDLLERSPRQKGFEDDEAFYLAFCGLASALEQLHQYSNDDLDIRLIGCHHDLKPRNVLVDGPRFLLADFGLSEMRDSEAALLREPDADRDLYFDSPEHLDYLTSSNRATGTASDIWSLGCILAVVFAYMKGGPQEVKNFRDQRRYIRLKGKKGTVLKSFHKNGNAHPKVADWLDGKNWHNSTPTLYTPVEAELVALIKDMLSIEPERRPDIREVLCRLRRLALKKAADTFQEHPHVHHPQPTNIDFVIERQVVLEWLQRIDDGSNTEQKFLTSDAMFRHVHGLVCDIRIEFGVLDQVLKHERPLFARLRRLNEELLLSCFDSKTRRSVREDAELHVLPTVVLQDEQIGANQDEGAPRRLVLPTANVRRLMRSSGAKVPRIEPGRVRLASSADEELRLLLPGSQMADEQLVRTFQVGTLDAGTASAQRVIVEEMPIIRHDYNDARMSKLLFESLDKVLGLAPREAAEWRALSCAGIYHSEKRGALGLVYSWPVPAESSPGDTIETCRSVCPLVEIFSHHPQPTCYDGFSFVSLDDRFRLAYDLAAAISRFHAIGWLHKDVSSYNILLFNTKFSPDALSSGDVTSNEVTSPQRLFLGHAALIGFSHSRPDKANYSNKMHIADEALFPYRHPAYAGADTNEHRTDSYSQNSYKPEYDYYSMGLVLLEIGLWASVETMLNAEEPNASKSMSADKVREVLVERYIPFLESTMGQAYVAAVRACLSEGWLEEGTGKVDKNFDRLVVRPLQQLCSTRSKV